MTLVESDELRRLALAEMRREYRGVDISIDHVTNEQARSNWSINVVSFGSHFQNAVRHAAIVIQIKLARDYQLLMPAD